MFMDHLRFFAPPYEKTSRSVFWGSLRLFPRFWRLSMVLLLVSLYVLSSWSRLVSTASAASSIQPSHQQAPLASVHASSARLAATAAGGLDGNGEAGFYTYVSESVNDHLKVEVNVGNGNLVVHASDLHIQGTTLDLSLELFYNAQTSSNRLTSVAPHWNLSTGADVYLQFNGDSSITFFGPSGFSAVFQPNGSGGFLNPTGLNATLTKPGSYQITFHKNGESFLFDSSGRLTADKEKNGEQITFTYNGSSHQLTTITDTQGRVTRFSYDGHGRLSVITDPTGRTVQYSYHNDSAGNLANVVDAAGHTTSFTYASGTTNLIQITDSASHVIHLAYSGNQIATLTDATGAVTSFAYSSGQTVLTDARGNKTTYQLDSGFKVTKAIDALGHSRSLQYSPNDDVTVLMDQLGNTTQFQFDANNNITSTTEATGAKDSFTYQDGSHLFYPTGSTNAQGSSLAYTYDTPGNVTSVKNVTSVGGGETTTYIYNSNGTVASMTDGNGNTTSYSYDSTGNLIQVTPPSPLGTTQLQHDGISRTTSMTDGNGQVTSYTYDVLDRIIKITYADGTTISYVRDAAGNVTSFTDTTGTTTFQYDADNRITQKKLPNGTILSYSYDAVGNATSFTDAGGTVSYSYNTVDLPASLTDPSGAQTTFGYDNRNERTSVNEPNGVVISLTYDSAGHETSIIARHGSTTLAGYNYTYGTTDLRQNMTDQVTGLVSTYHYDTLNRLTEDAVTQGSNQVNDFQYSFDKAGNRTSQTVNGSQITYSYNAANELTQQTNGDTVTNYSYDANGNLTESMVPLSDTATVFTYNAKDQMTDVRRGTINDPLTYTGSDQTERVSSGFTTYVNAPFGVSSQTDSSGTTYFTREINGGLVNERTPSGTYYYLFDGLGSVVGLTDSSGNLVGNERYVYDPYGNITNTVSSTPMQLNPWRFASGYQDGTSGFTKFGIRYDATNVGRWTQHTPIGGSLAETIKANSYVCTADNPVNMVDPSGGDTINCIGAWALLALGLVVAAATIIAAVLAAPAGVGFLGALISGSTFLGLGGIGWGVIAGFGGALIAVGGFLLSLYNKACG